VWSLRVWVGILCSCMLWLSWVGFGGFFLSVFGLFFFISSFAFSLVYCQCTKGRLALLIKSVYYLSKKRNKKLCTLISVECCTFKPLNLYMLIP
jgi:hypothetical protein